MAKGDPSKIYFHFLVPPFFFPDRTRVKQFITDQLRQKGKVIDTINVVFCDDDYLLEINEKYLNHETFTDIITFELSFAGQPLLADIYISVQRVRENSKIFADSFSRELLRVIFHGMLHLCGLGDKSPKEAAKMRSAEADWLTKYFVPRETPHSKH